MTAAKNPAFIGLYLELLFRGDQFLVGEIKFGGGSLLGGMSKFSAGRGGGDSTPIPPRKENAKQFGVGVEIGISRGITEIACEISSD